jgi:hypothetical protein
MLSWNDNVWAHVMSVFEVIIYGKLQGLNFKYYFNEKFKFLFNFKVHG